MRFDEPADVDAFTIDKVYPWGRSLDEYRRMFDMSAHDLASSSIVSLADGPASFNAELTRRGGRVVSCDPLYRFSAGEIRGRVEATREVLVDVCRRNTHRFVWSHVRSPEHLAEMRTQAMETFLDDYEPGRREGRYLDRSLPFTGFLEDEFDLALSSHFLFLYSEDFSLSFHVDAVAEMTRIAREVRIFPLLDMRGEGSRYVEPVIEACTGRGLRVERQTVDYEFQRGGNEMLRVTRG